MLGLRYYKADPATYLIQTRGGKVRRQGRGLSFFFYAPKSSLTAVPVSAQEAPFIFCRRRTIRPCECKGRSPSGPRTR